MAQRSCCERTCPSGVFAHGEESKASGGAARKKGTRGAKNDNPARHAAGNKLDVASVVALWRGKGPCVMRR